MPAYRLRVEVLSELSWGHPGAICGHIAKYMCVFVFFFEYAASIGRLENKGHSRFWCLASKQHEQTARDIPQFSKMRTKSGHKLLIVMLNVSTAFLLTHRFYRGETPRTHE